MNGAHGGLWAHSFIFQEPSNFTSLHHRPFATMTSVFLLVALVVAAAAKKQEYEFATMAAYQPLTDVRDIAAIDLDIQLFKELLSSESELENAKRVYEIGAFSRSYAELSLGFNGLPGDINGHTIVTGMAESGETITGVSLDDGTMGSKTIRVQYHNQDNFAPCFVGGNPEPQTEGCFASTGQLTFDTMMTPVPYSYNIKYQNHNDRILAWVSMHAERKMRPCGNCELFDTFFRYYTWYGKHDFSHRWVMAALTGSRMVFDTSAVDFTAFSFETRAVGATTALVLLSFYPFVIRELEVSVHECRKDCDDDSCQLTATRLADSAFAFYAGSLEDGSGSGHLLYSVAEEQCKAFKTCGAEGDSTRGVSKVNQVLLEYFHGFQMNITSDDCWDAHAKKDLIARQMKVPLVQGTLRYAHKIANKQNTPSDSAIGAAFAAAISPLVSACNFKDAEIIDNNMEITSTSTNFVQVKETLEKHYKCLGITCKDVGGLWDEKAREYYEGAGPCHFDDVVEKVKTSNRGKILSLAIGLPLLFALVTLYVLHLQNQARLRLKKHRMEHPDEYSDSEDDDDDRDVRFI